MNDILSIWRSPLDGVALKRAEELNARQPMASIGWNEDFSQITAYNYLTYGANRYGGGPASNNDGALTAMFSAMMPPSATNNGGTAFIEQYMFPIDAQSGDPLGPYVVPDQTIMLGLGTGGQSGSNSFFHFSIMGSGGSAGNPYYFLTTTATGHTSGGVVFQNLAFLWNTGESSTGYETCIGANSWNCRAINCNFVNCPTAFYGNAESCGLIECTIQYLSGPDGAVAVYLLGPECYAIGPSQYFQATAGGTPPGPANCSGIVLGGNNTGSGVLEHAMLRDLHLSDWYYGIDYSKVAGVEGSNIDSVEAQCFGACVYMTPPDSSGVIYGEKYTSCHFEKSGDSDDGTAIVYIDTSTGVNNNINDIEFLNCTVYSSTSTPQSSQYCYQIRSGNNIRIIGGTTSNAGAPGSGSAQIAITSPPTGATQSGPGRITILGVDLSQSYPNAKHTHSTPFALLISATPTDVVTVDNCKMTGYSASPVHVTAAVANVLYIRNCEGYSDLNTPILSGAGHAPVGVAVSASIAGTLTGGTNYFGPSLVIFTNASSTANLTFTINTVGWTVPPKGFVTYYIASPYDTIEFGATPGSFSWIGK